MQSGNKFSPASLSVAVGDKVKVVNDDNVAHNWVKSGTFDSGVFTGGGSYTFTVPSAGQYDYVCTLHPGMNGSFTAS